jgi:hypothetical protein
MNNITKHPLSSLGYHFIPAEYLPKGKDEYHLRNMQNSSGIQYRQLNAHEIEVLVRNRNQSDDWNKILVSDAFNPELVKNCKFYGLIRIGKLEPWYLEFKNLRRPVGLYNSTICSCDFGDNVVVDNVNYLSHYIIGNDVILVNVEELATTNYAKFGNGIVKIGEPEHMRIWLEICNENGGRSVIPFNGMLPGDAYLWSRFRDDQVLQEKFKDFTEKKFDRQRGYYGKIGHRTVIKNCKTIKDVWVGSDAYLKGANKLKNLTINSSPEAPSQVGEGCELVNGIVDYGCRIFYGVKAVRFVMASHSQLKYGARLINSYLGNNATISCCEVLNSLIFPAHEQHHNNSFLCASLVMGQSNMAAGATIGSNHNSRSPDGELIAGRGFWPGLCVSLKHNSKFASFNILAKGDYPSELRIPIPFALVSNDVTLDRLLVMPGYWFMYNMYALARNSWKYKDRDKRTEKIQDIEYDFLAPDSIGEMADALRLFEVYTGRAWQRLREGESFDSKNPDHKNPDRRDPGGINPGTTDSASALIGRRLLTSGEPALQDLEILADNFEHSSRKVVLAKVPQAYALFLDLIAYHASVQIMAYLRQETRPGFDDLIALLPKRPHRSEWYNVGGQFIKKETIESFRKRVHTGKIKSWEEVHDFYRQCAETYSTDKLVNALAVYSECLDVPIGKMDKPWLRSLLRQAVKTRIWMMEGIYTSREKDYTNPFRSMVYDSEKEMETVIGALESNSFLSQERKNLHTFTAQVEGLLTLLA